MITSASIIPSFEFIATSKLLTTLFDCDNKLDGPGIFLFDFVYYLRRHGLLEN